MRTLRLEEFSDREFLYAVEDAIDGDGFATAREIQATLQLDHPHATRCIGSRCGYLRSIGVLAFDVERPGARHWTITKAGLRVMRGELTAAQRRAIGALRPEQTVAAAREVGERLLHADGMHRTMMRRAWRYADAQTPDRR